MIHLKRFNESNQSDIDFHLQVIKDVFQDLIDEWDLEFCNWVGIGTAFDPGNHFSLRAFDNSDIIIDIFNKANKVSVWKHVSSSPTFKKDVVDNISRLRRMGYDVQYNDHHHIKIFISY